MDYRDINKRLWDSKTDIHYKSDFYDVDSFLKGKDSLNPIGKLFPDARDIPRSLLHTIKLASLPG